MAESPHDNLYENKDFRHYHYVGPDHLKQLVDSPPNAITTQGELECVIKSLDIGTKAEERTATFIIDIKGYLRLADRRSEHMCCAGGGDVLSAGEIMFDCDDDYILVEWITNQSTGYCPEPQSWPAVEQALKRINVIAPNKFSMAINFRRCEKCSQINIVKDACFECEVCNARLPRKWKLD